MQPVQAQAQNTIKVYPYNLVIKGKNKPYSNNFVVESAKVVQYNNKDEIACFVRCTATSKEPGRIYFAQYSTKGVLQECYTVN
jgi:hypothetical protein